MHLSYYFYSIISCQQLTFDGDESICNGFRSLLSRFHIEEGSNQFGRIVYTKETLSEAEAFAKANRSSWPQAQRLVSYLRSLNEGDYFYIIDSNFPVLNRYIALVWLRAHNMGLDPRQACDNYLCTLGLLKTRFDYQSFGFDNLQQFIGEKDKSKRTCRFCHGITKENPNAAILSAKGTPIIQFGKPQNAHAISDALGNKILFNLEECTTCNSTLSRVEANLIALMDWRRALMGIKGKDNAIPNVFGEEAASRVAEDGTQILYINENIAQSYISENILTLRLNNKKTITDQGVYKALCKYAIGLMPASYLPHFQQTIDWICGRLNEVELPEVMQAYNIPFVSQPILDLFFKKKGNQDTPLCTAMLHVCDICYLFILPLADTDGARFKTKGSLSNHWVQFQQCFPACWQSTDLSNYRPATPWLDIEVPVDGKKVVLVPHDDPRLKQPTSLPKPGATVKPKPVEHQFPEFDKNCIKYINSVIIKFDLFHTGTIPSDALHNATIVIDGILCRIDLTNNTALIETTFTISSPDGNTPYFSFGFRANFTLAGADAYIAVGCDYVSLDYNLRDALFYTACIETNPLFKEKLKDTRYSICSLPKSLCDDERNVLFIYYTLITDGGVFQFRDRDIHNDPFNV